MPRNVPSFEELRKADNLPTSCIGSALKDKKCHNPIARPTQETLDFGLEILRCTNQASVPLKVLEDIASRCLCKSYHQEQKRAIAQIWFAEVSALPTAEDRQHDLKVENQRLRRQRNAYKEQVGTLQTNLGESQAQYAQLADQVDYLRGERDILVERNTELRTELIRFDARVNQLETRIHEADDTAANLRGQIEEFHTEIRKLESTISDFESKVNALDHKNKSVEDDVAWLEKKLENLRLDRDQLESDKTELEQELDNAVSTTTTLHENNKMLRAKIQKLEGDIQCLEKENENLRAELVTSQTTCQELEGKVAELSHTASAVRPLQDELHEVTNPGAIVYPTLVGLEQEQGKVASSGSSTSCMIM